MNEKTGVFLCGCGENIGGLIDLEKLAGIFEKRPEVAFVTKHNLLCSPDGKQFFVEQMKGHDADRAVVAGCSPKEHESTFRKCMALAGRNEFMVQMANIREHCSWVTSDREKAFQKSAALVRAALKRVGYHEALVTRRIECSPDLLVIGGGIAGIEAALMAAQGDRHVFLVEKSPSLGGLVPEYEDVAPNLECASCMIAPRLSEISDSKNVEILTNSEVRQVLGYLGNFEITVEQKARLVDETLCMGCDECMKACPVETPAEFDHGLGARHAIYIPFPGSVPNCAVIDRDNCLRFKGKECTLCADACPMGAVDFNQADRTRDIKAGAVILATGCSTFDPKGMENLGYGRLPDVYTLGEFERIANSNGPTGGKIQKRDGLPPKSIAVVHCVGRRSLGYCSDICCQSALKVGALAIKRETGCAVTHLHTDLVSPGRMGKVLFSKTNGRFIRVSDPDSVSIETDGIGMDVMYADTAGTTKTLSSDMVVLVTGLEKNASAALFGDMLDLIRDDSGFLAADHPILRSCQASLEGVFMAGCVSGPKGIPASVAQGQAAAGLAMARLIPGRTLEIEAMTALMAEELCSGCGLCVAVCPYKACAYTEDRTKVVVNDVLCRGCGTCVAACPSGAAQARHFTDEQIRAEMLEVLYDRP